MRRLLSILLFGVSLLTATYLTAQTCSVPIFTVTQTFFGITQNSYANPLWSASFNAGIVRLWDTPFVWPLINTSAGVFTYSTANDALISTIVSSGAQPDFVFGRTPSWDLFAGATCTGSYHPTGCAQRPADVNTGNATLIAMVNSLVTHLASTHPGVHWIMECVNEADLNGEWVNDAGTGRGSMTDLVAYCTALKTAAHAADASIIVLGPSGSSINASNIHLYNDGNNYAGTAGAAASMDAMNFHGYLQSCSTYCTVPELLQTAWGQVTNLTKNGGLLAGKPVYITEANWGGTPPANNANLTDLQKEQYLSRTYMYAFLNNVASLEWYAYDSHPDNLSSAGAFGTMCAGSPPTSCTPLPVATTMATMESVLVGATFFPGPCAQDPKGTWTCNLISSPASTGKAQIMWNATTTETLTVPSVYTKVINMNDGTQTAIVSHQVTAGPSVVTAIP